MFHRNRFFLNRLFLIFMMWGASTQLMAALPTLPTVPSSMCTVNAVGWNFSFATDFPGEPSYRLDYTGVGWTYDAKKIPQRNNATAPVRNLVLGPAEKPTELRSNPVADGLGETWALVSRLEAAPGSSETINFEDLGGEDHDVFMVLDSAGNVLGRYPATGSDSVNNITASGTGINLSFTMPADGVVYAYSWLADFGVAWGIHVNNSCRIDYSDAASTYGTATHVIKKGLLQLGSQITLDTGVVTDADNASDDGVATFPTLSTDMMSYSVNTAVTNITGQAATLHGWIDFDRNGVFDADEYTSATVANGSTTAALNWSVPLDTVAGSTSARFRLTTDTLAAANTATAVSDGEVEDYTLTINAQTSATPNPTATACTAYRKYAVDDISAIPLKSAGTTLPISFTASGGTRNPQGLTATYAFIANGSSGGTAGRTSSATLTSPWTSSSWSPVEFSSTPTTPSSSASYSLTITLSQAVEGVGIMIGDIDKSAGSTGPAEGAARVMFKDAAGGVVALTQSSLPINTTATTSNYYLGSNLLAYGTAGAIANLGGNIATSVADSYATYQVSPNQKVKTIEIQYGGGDYLFSPVWYTDCYDFGDTPANGSTAPNGSATTTYGITGSHRLNASLYMGNNFDQDLTHQPDAAATGDDLNNLDDEDGITTLPNLLVSASNYSITTAMTNTTGTAGRLHGWMDLDGNGVFDSDEYTSVAVPTGSNKAAIALTWSSLPDLRAGSTFMRLRLTTGTLAATDATTTSSTINGEVEDYQITVVDPDPDHDGLTTALELVLGTNPLDADSDDDGLSDGAEDANKNGVVDTGETSPLKVDTDNDGIQDGTELGVTTPIPGGINPGNPAVSYVGTNTAVFIPDTDSTTKTDPLDSDTDNDGLLDGQEDANKNGAVNSGETNPLDADTDDDGLSDGAEDANKNGVVDTGETSPLKADTDNDGLQDGTEKGVTTAIAGGTSSGSTPVTYVGTNTTVFIPDTDSATKTDPLDTDTDNDGLLDGQEDVNRNGKVDAGETNPLDADSDDDGLSDGAEDANKNGVVDTGETSPLKVDTDNDGLQDGTEKGVTTAIAGGTSSGSTPVTYVGTNTTVFIPDTDSATKTDPLDSDTDNDGLLDGQEDANKNGAVNSGETNPLDADTDDDGLSDGTEDANKNGVVDTGETSPLKVDTDNDGLQDGTEKGITAAIVGGTSSGSSPVTYVGTNTAVFVPDTDSTTKTDPLDSDTDNDGLLDGQEDVNRNGKVDAGETNPLDADTDDDGLSDGAEDANKNGVVDATETSPLKVDTDNDGLQDGTEKGVTTAIAGGTSSGSTPVTYVT